MPLVYGYPENSWITLKTHDTSIKHIIQVYREELNMKKQLLFTLDKSKILNSNSMPNHYIVKGKIVSYLRKMAAEEGLTHHKPEDIKTATKRLMEIYENANTTQIKKRERALLKKEHPDLNKKEIEALIEKKFDNLTVHNNNTLNIPYLFDKFKVIITVCPPSKRRMDPPNFYPTVKAIIDGLTDASWWEDDNFQHLYELSFRYGEPTGETGIFRLYFDIEEINTDIIDNYKFNNNTNK